MKNENFYNDIFYYSPTYYPGYKINKIQEKKFLTQFPYIKKELKKDQNKDLQVFYNITTSNRNNELPWGSTYKYTIPKSIDDTDDTSYNSISERQKRARREFFNNVDIKSNNNILFIYIFIIVILYIIFLQ